MLIYELESFALYHHPEKSCDHKECKSVDITFLICHVNFFVSTYLKGYKKLRVEGPYRESLSCHVLRSLFQCKCIYKLFKMSHDLTKLRD